jgi:hypothetical protein
VDALDDALAGVRADYPGWQVWVVRRAVGGPVWCARRHGEPHASLHGYSEHELREYLDGVNHDNEP